MVWYRAVKRTETSVEKERYETYDLQVYRVSLRGVKLVVTVRDVSTDRALVRRIAVNCTKGQLDPLHVYDVVVDSIP